MRYYLIAMMALVLNGCQNQGLFDPKEEEQEQQPKDFEIVVPKTSVGKPSQQLLAEAALSVSRSLGQLAEMQRAKNPDLYRALPQQPLTKDSAKLASVKWTGPVEPLLEQMAKKSGMRFLTQGQKTATPIIVSIDVKQTSVADIIKNIAYQAQNHAAVMIDPKEGSINIRYLHG